MSRRVLDLFSGIGGFSLGLERAGWRTVAFCEIDAYCRSVLRKHWPDVPCYTDVRDVTGSRLAADGIVPDLVCGGFPCQDISFAGRGAGLDGKRSGLWFEYRRIIEEVRPSWVIIENVSALRSRGLDVVLGQLAALGFDAWWDCIPAAHLGAPHERDRLWLVAYAAGLRREQGQRAEETWRRLIRARQLGGPSPWASSENNDEIRSRFLRVVDGVSHHVDRLRALGNAVVPQIPEIIGRAIIAAETEAV